MFEYLVSDDQVELLRKPGLANIEFGELRCSVGFEVELATPMNATEDFKHIQIFRSQAAHKFKAIAVHDDPHPIDGVIANELKDGFQPLLNFLGGRLWRKGSFDRPPVSPGAWPFAELRTIPATRAPTL